MKVTLLNHTPLSVGLIAIRNCYSSFGNSDTEALFDNLTDDIGLKDSDLLTRIIQSKHSSTVEHINYTFMLQGVPRSVLQELVRHRIASYSVKSSRYTLVKELRNEDEFIVDNEDSLNRAKKYISLACEPELHSYQIVQLEALRKTISDLNFNSSDKIKLLLPESWLTDIVMTINARSLANFLTLRLAKTAYKPIQELASLMLSSIPEKHRILFSDVKI